MMLLSCWCAQGATTPSGRRSLNKRRTQNRNEPVFCFLSSLLFCLCHTFRYCGHSVRAFFPRVICSISFRFVPSMVDGRWSLVLFGKVDMIVSAFYAICTWTIKYLLREWASSTRPQPANGHKVEMVIHCVTAPPSTMTTIFLFFSLVWLAGAHSLSQHHALSPPVTEMYFWSSVCLPDTPEIKFKRLAECSTKDNALIPPIIMKTKNIR